jgi:hypothetical protein
MLVLGSARSRALHSYPHCPLTVYRCSRTNSPPPPPWFGRPFHYGVLIMYQRTPTHAPRPRPWPGHWLPDCLLVLHQYTCKRTRQPPPRCGCLYVDRLLIVLLYTRTHALQPSPVSCTCVTGNTTQASSCYPVRIILRGFLGESKSVKAEA